MNENIILEYVLEFLHTLHCKFMVGRIANESFLEGKNCVLAIESLLKKQISFLIIGQFPIL